MERIRWLRHANGDWEGQRHGGPSFWVSAQEYERQQRELAQWESDGGRSLADDESDNASRV